MAANVWTRFKALLPSRALQVVTVLSVNANGTSQVQSDAGNEWTVLGDSVAAGGKALVQDGRIIAEAADLPTYTVSV
jgi:hypothetical protein